MGAGFEWLDAYEERETTFYLSLQRIGEAAGDAVELSQASHPHPRPRLDHVIVLSNGIITWMARPGDGEGRRGGGRRGDAG